MKIEFYEISKAKYQLTYVVICAKFQNQWIFVRHKDRTSWEIPGGHIELNESADEAAARELNEESGAIKYELKALCDYSVQNSKAISYGRLYYAMVEEFQMKLEYEIEEIIFADKLPDELTYQEILPHLFKEVQKRNNEY